MIKDDSVYLQHIIDAIQRIQEYTTGIDYEAFGASTLVQDGVIRQIEIIGEAARRVSPKLQEKNQHIPWKDIVGMRNKLIHDYFGVDIDAVWDTVQKDIPVLQTAISKIPTTD